jgi:hypothetical protein
MKRVITEEMYAEIPSLVAAGMSGAEIANRFGVKVTSLTVMCSRPLPKIK